MIGVSALARSVLLAASVAFVASCAPAPSSLAVQLRTDLAPGREFDAISVSVTAATGAPRMDEVVADGTRSFARPARLAELSDLPDGRYRVVITLRLGDTVVQTQPRRVEVHGATTVTVAMTRDCAGIACPSASEPAAEACLGGRCVDPGCGEEGAPACGSECQTDAQCPASSVACVVPRCVAGVCFAEADDTRCMPGELCDTELGCGGHVALPAPSLRMPANGFDTGSPFDADGTHPQAGRYLEMRWLGVAGASSYEVQLDDSCELATFETCAFPSPEVDDQSPRIDWRVGPLDVSLVAPVGRRYFLRVRACGASRTDCGAWSDVRYVDVGRQPTDVDRDGYADVLVGVPDTPSVGAIDIHRGHAAGADAQATRSLRSSAPSTRFGFALAVGDFSESGLPAIVATRTDTATNTEGTVTLELSSPTRTETFPDPGQPRDQAFGAALAVGDLDADGYDDLAVGAPRLPGVASRSGGVYVFHGSASGLDLTTSELVQVDDPVHGGLGRSLAIGDVDGDGVADLVASAPHQPTSSSSGPGAVYVFRGRHRAPLETTPFWQLEDPTHTADAEFGAQIALGDLSGDGIADLLIGAPQEQPTAGTYTGAAYRVDGGSAGALVRIDPPMSGSIFFGRSVAIVRGIAQDERAAALLGAPYGNGAAGAVFRYYDGVVTEVPTAAPAGAQLGWAVADVGDTDGDGFDEAALGGPQSATGGYVLLVRGDVTSSPGSLPLMAFIPMPADHYGWAFAR